MSTAPVSSSGRWLRRVLRMLLLFLLVGAVIAAGCIYVGVSTSVHAEKALHATNEVCNLMTEYVQQHNGAWPRSWHEFEQLSLPPNKYSFYHWPEDSKRLQEFVAIDFAADPEQLAKQSVDEFDAIKPIGPYYPYKFYGHVASLLKALCVSRHAPQSP